ncbi:integrase [Cyanosarcina cf. burmensis CCALA 770]|nr:integrase [Cyanosarcina cf. burmensis CCALA 770]
MALHLHPHPRIKIISATNATEERLASVDNTQDIRLGWIEQYIRANNLAKNTQKTYRLELERFAAWSNKAWADVTPRDIARFKHYLMTECKTRAGKPLMPASVNQALAALKSFYSWFRSSGYMDLTAVLPTAAVKFEKLGKPLPKNLSDEQMQAIAAVVAGGEEVIQLRDRALLAILTHGLRAGDISALNVGNYDGIRLRFFRDKDNSEALVPLRQAARQQIDAYLEWRRREREVLTNDSPLLLSHDFRSPLQRLGYQGIYYFVKERLGKAAGIPNLTPHQFRHTYAANLVEMGIDTLLARSLTGHSSERVFQRYIEGKRLSAAEQAFYRAIGEEAPQVEN